MEKKFLQQLGTGVASLTFGVALSIFIYAVASGMVGGLHAWLLFGASFLLMLRFWWRYSELFVQFLPSRNFWHFLLDFAISFFGILAVLFVSNIQIWALLGAATMLSSIIRCSLSWTEANKEIKRALKMTIAGSAAMLAIMVLVWLLAFFVTAMLLSGAVLALVIIFVALASRKRN